MNATQESKINVLVADFFKFGITTHMDSLNESIESMYESFTNLCMGNASSYPEDVEDYKFAGLEKIHQLNLIKKFICQIYDAHVVSNIE